MFGTIFLVIATICASPERASDGGPGLDLSKAVVWIDPELNAGSGKMAGPLLIEEVQKRTGLKLETTAETTSDRPTIVIVRRDSKTTDAAVLKILSASKGTGPTKVEGFELFVDERSRPGVTVAIVGADDRGALYGVGALLRRATLLMNSFRIPDGFRLDTSPAFPIRGHQLGYRAAANSYDAWDVDRYEAYFRDMLVFGCNSVELIPPMDRNSPRNRHMPKSEWDMTVALSSLLDKYGMDCWLWPPIEDVDVSKADQAEAFLKKRDELFRACKRIDAIFIPGGDPGDTPPHLLLPFMERLTEVLHKSHPKAQVWLSPQMFQTAELETFFQLLEKQQPKWLTGIVYGPWIWTSLEETRKRVPAQYPIRNYPDITHTVRCQFAVPNFDQALAFTLGREPINPRPRAYARIHKLQSPLTKGSITYSDGCNDDVNKMVLSVLDWDPNHDVEDALRQYGRYFFNAVYADDVAKGLLALEDNLVGPARTSTHIPATLVLWRDLETRATDMHSHWRFQQPLFRAYFDAYQAERARLEAGLEVAAMDELRKAGSPRDRSKAARAKLAEADKHSASPDCRKRIFELADALFASIGMQLDTAKYGASGSERGAVLDYLDEPLNNRRWLEARLAEIGKVKDVAAANKLIDAIAKYDDPGPGGFYDDLGNPERQPHLVAGEKWDDDPAYLRSPQAEHNLNRGSRLSWLTQSETLYAQPLRMRYTGLDTSATYRVKIVYFGRFRSTMSLDANGIAIHGALPKEDIVKANQPVPVEFAVPKEATKTGTLELTWRRLSGRGCQVAEVFLLKD